MSRVLWICNIMLPVIGKELGMPYSNREGWLSGIFARMHGQERAFELGICFPLGKEELGEAAGEPLAEGVKRLSVQETDCYAFEENLGTPESYDERMEEVFRRIFQDFGPDMVHIFGTEFPHCLAAVKALGRPERTLIGIQGLCGEIAKVYMAGIPERVQRQVTFRDFLRKDSIRQQQQKFILRGEHERQALAACGNITGRTRFDREGTAKINPRARYFFMNETMRTEFYEGEWCLENCEEHSIFLGQGDYPLKGMHFVLKAMALLLEKYPDMKLYVAGNSVIAHGSFKEKLRLSAYGKYLLSLIREYGLQEKVVMLGKLEAPEMKQRFLKSSVFVCPSVLENSPNTVGEAMLLGVPLIASEAGGIPDMVTDGRDGLLFPAGDEKKLARAFDVLWDRTKGADGLCLAERLSMQARKRARETHDGEQNYQRLVEIYGEIMR